MKRWPRMVAAIIMVVLAAGGAGAQEDPPEMDPLLKLLVEQGIITQAQAEGVQREYDRRQGKAVDEPTGAPAVVEQPVVEDAQPQVAAETKAPEKWYDRIDFKGDLRLRFEAFDQEGISSNNRRERFRVRIRPGIYTQITDWMDVGLQLRSGDPQDPVSDNATIDGGFTMKDIAISEGFAHFDPTSWLDLTFGKFDPRKKWTVTDMQWDDDVTVEGAMEEFSIGFFEANLYQYSLEEVRGGSDAYLLVGQVLGKFGSDAIGTFKVGGGYDNWIRPQLVADLTLSGDLRGNEVTNLLDDNDQLVSDFQIFNAFASWSFTRSERWPIKVYLFGYTNTGAAGLGQDYDTGYFARVQVGDFKKKGQFMFRLSRYYSEPDALFYVFAQSDTTRASDVDGYRFDVRMGFVKRSFFNLTWYHTDAVYADVPTMDRLQMDYIIVF